jgi:organic radical activating enzyme
LDTAGDIMMSEGKKLPVMEEFYSIQGEGFNTGQAAYFIRIGGCDVGCNWCDIKESWNAGKCPPVQTDEIIRRASECPAKAVVITGGEPLNYNLDYLCNRLHASGMRIFIETSGSRALSGNFDWICLSPKKSSPPLQPVYKLADELKIIVNDETDLDWAKANAALVNHTCQLFLQPEWSRRNKVMPAIIDYIMAHPEWKISLQSHKYMRIP